jgi:hypothetical protein
MEKRIQEALGALMFQQLALSQQLQEAAAQTMAVFEALDTAWDGLPPDVQQSLLATTYGSWRNNRK